MKNDTISGSDEDMAQTGNQVVGENPPSSLRRFDENRSPVNCAPSLSSAGFSLQNIRDGPIRKIQVAERNSNVANQEKGEVRTVLLEGFGSPHTRRTSFEVSNHEAAVFKLVLLREELIKEISKLFLILDEITTSKDTNNARTAGIRQDISLVLARLRGASVEVTEAIADWRDAGISSRKERIFSFKHQNYLLKMSTDLEQLDPPLARHGFSLVASRNPFLIPGPFQPDDRAQVQQAWDLRPLPPDLHTRCFVAERVMEQEFQREKVRSLRSVLCRTKPNLTKNSESALDTKIEELRMRALTKSTTDALRKRQERVMPKSARRRPASSQCAPSETSATGVFPTQTSLLSSKESVSTTLRANPEHVKTGKEMWRRMWQRRAQARHVGLLVNSSDEVESSSSRSSSSLGASVPSSAVEDNHDNHILLVGNAERLKSTAVVEIQRVARGASSRRLTAQVRSGVLAERRARDALQQAAFTFGQESAANFFRGAVFFMHERRADESVGVLVLAELRKTAATAIQKIGRGRRARLEVAAAREQAAIHRAAVRLQSMVRGCHVRLQKKKWDAERKAARQKAEHIAATRIQAVCRSHLARNAIAEIKKRLLAEKDPVSMGKRIATLAAADAAQAFDSLARELSVPIASPASDSARGSKLLRHKLQSKSRRLHAISGQKAAP